MVSLYRKAGLQISAQNVSNYGLFQQSKEVFEAWEKTRDVADVLKAKIIVFQCPAKFTPDAENIENMRHFFSNIDRRGFTFVWEPRGEWDDDIIRALCRDLDLVRYANSLERAEGYGKLKYFRLNEGHNYRHQYTDDELAKLWELSSNEVYVLFNNITMYDDALRFKKLVESKH